MALFSLISGAFKNNFFSFSPYFFSHLMSLQTAKKTFIKSAVLWLYSSKFKPNKYSLPQN